MLAEVAASLAANGKSTAPPMVGSVEPCEATTRRLWRTEKNGNPDKTVHSGSQPKTGTSLPLGENASINFDNGRAAAKIFSVSLCASLG